MIRAHTILLLLLLANAITLRSQHALDSLKQLLYETNDNKHRVDILIEISNSVYDTDVNEGFKFASEAYEHAHAMNYDVGEKRSLILMGFRYTVSGEFQKALSHYRQAGNVDENEDDLLAYSYVMIGNVYRTIARFDSAHFYYAKSIGMLQRLNSPVFSAFAYKSLARLYVIQWKNNEAEFYFKKAQKIYEEQGDRRGISESWFFLSDVYKNLTDYKLADECLSKGCDIATTDKNDYLLLLCYKNRGDYFYHLGEYHKSLDVLFKALDILKTKEHPQLLASIFDQLGEIYEELGQHDVALKYYFDALKIIERIGVRYEMGKLYGEVGWIYKNQLNFVQAKSYMDKSLAIREEIKDDHGISHSYNILGVLAYQEGRYTQALDYLEKSLAIRKRIGHREGVSACIFNMALVYEELGQYQKALEYNFKALEIDERIGSKLGLAVSYNQIGQVYTKAGNFEKATEYLNKAKNLSTETGSKMLIMNNRLFFSELYEAKGDTKRALELHKQYTQLNDSIYSEGNAMKLAEMQALYQVEQKNQEIELLNQNKEIQNNQIQLQRSQIGQQRTIIISGLVGLVLIGLFAFKTYQYTIKIRRANREIIEQKEEIQAQSEELIGASKTIAQINMDLKTKVEERTSALRQAYKELDTFFYRSSHDFRRPLTTFLGLAEVAKITVKDENALELFSKVKETASNLDKMLIKLQSVSDIGTQQLVYKEVFVKEIFDNVFDGFAEELRTRNIRVSCSLELKESFYSYPAMFKTIIENLVENSIFFSGLKDPYIKVRGYDLDHAIVFEIEDNGQGIDVQYQDRIFDMYFRGNERSKGNGLGLYIVKKAVEKLDGEITFKSEFSKGTTFRLTLPTAMNNIGD